MADRLILFSAPMVLALLREASMEGIGVFACLLGASLIALIGMFVAIKQGEYLPMAIYGAFALACCVALSALLGEP